MNGTVEVGHRPSFGIANRVNTRKGADLGYEYFYRKTVIDETDDIGCRKLSYMNQVGLPYQDLPHVLHRPHSTFKIS